MPTTARDIVKRSIGRIGVLGTGQPMSAEMAEKTLQALNGIMHSWQRKGLSYIHSTMTLDSYFPIGEEFEEPVAAILAMRMTDDYAPEAATAKLKRDAREGWAMLCGAMLDIPISANDMPTTERSLPKSMS